VIVMLRRGPNEAEAHYLSTDLVLATDEERERRTKEHLPLLRSIAVRTLSGYSLPDASAMTVEQYAALLNKTFDASYAKENHLKPFSEVMIGKLIIE
jgi:flagellar FliL protein